MIQHSNTAEEAVTFEDFPIAIPSLVLHILTTCDLAPRDLAILEKTCKFFRDPGSFGPGEDLSIAEVAALDLCEKRSLFRPMSSDLKRKCGGSWKLVLRYLKAREFCCRKGKSQAIAGPRHSIVVTSKGAVYSFGINESGQLGLGKTDDDDDDDTIREPRLIRSLQGIKIVQVAVGGSKTMLVSDTGRAYAMGLELFGHSENSDHEASSIATVPKMVESLKDIFVVQVAIGNFFTAVLSGEGTVYTLCWGGGSDGILGHQSDVSGVNPTPLLGELENRPVVQISAGNCYLLALVCEPSGMSVYSVGCGMGGKLGHGSISDEKYPRMIKELEKLNVEPRIVSAGAWHAAVVAKDGRVCTWGWGDYGCLGHGDEKFVSAPKVVEGLSHVKAVNVATGVCTTFVVSEDGSVYSFGIQFDLDGQVFSRILKPRLNQSLVHGEDRVLGINTTNSGSLSTLHTFAMTESGKLYASGSGDKGQLGVKLQGEETVSPKLVAIDLS